MPLPPATSAGRTVMLEGFFTVLTLSREEAVTACPGSCTFETCHECIDLPLRSPRNSTSLGVVIGVVVPATFPLGCRGRCSRVLTALDVQPGHPTPKTTSPTLSSYTEARKAYIMMGNDQSRGGRGRHNTVEPWKLTTRSPRRDP
ncbi:hypothetical protein CRG98_030321 [Punica granatum]|uniref:Uncharacterized protein n=1 Tax=Punica granatum TaxID=22663 RepID=A0A2I0IZ51_PUNGR|nr:hypothetical protein CRG98_030321 [Punica granatum]